jgi:hypothetical protein
MANLNETQNQNNNAEALNFAVPENGFGTYLINILPEDQRVLAGALSTAMQQIKNIDQVQADKFAQAAYSTENMFGLNLVNGTDVPTDQMLAKISQSVCALGGGVYGTYTMSNFFGAMSGLPYPLREIYDAIKTLDDSSSNNNVAGSLQSIYENIWLSVTWEQALATLTVTRHGTPGNYTWTVDDIVITNFGGGYQRGNTPSNPVAVPYVKIKDAGGNEIAGFAPVATVESNNRLLTYYPSNIGRKYGSLYDINWSKTYNSTVEPASIEIEIPPTTFGGAGWTGSPNMNNAVQHYIDEANAEISAILTSNPANFDTANILNTNWLITGKALKQEQRARYISNSPVPVPYDQWLAMYPQSIYTFVDAIPGLGANTLPHMYAQTLENISDLNLVGGQSIIALMRESRNQQRLNNAGLQLDNNLASDLDSQSKTQLITNNTIPGALDGVNGYTIPAFTEKSVPASYYDPCLPGLMCYNEIQYVENNPVSAILASPPPEPEPEPPESPTGYEPPPTPEVLPAGTDVVVPDTNFPCEGTVVDPIYGAKPAPVATSKIGTGTAVPCDPPTDYPLGVNQPKNIIPPELDAEFTSSGLSPSAPTVQQAINQVILCNCDCWVV